MKIKQIIPAPPGYIAEYAVLDGGEIYPPRPVVAFALVKEEGEPAFIEAQVLDPAGQVVGVWSLENFAGVAPADHIEIGRELRAERMAEATS